MSDVIVICTDGSDIATQAASAGLSLLRRDARVILVTVIEDDDDSLVTGTGFAGGVMSSEEFDKHNTDRRSEAAHMLTQLATSLGISDARTEILHGSPGPAVCDFASEVSAALIVLGTRGRGGLKRAFLGSVSDHVVRNAQCSVLVTGNATED